MGENLRHYGILGMKWGVRRTPEQLGRKPGKSKGSGDYQKSRKQLKRGAKNLSNKELQDLNKRLQMEKQLKDLNPHAVNKGKDFAKGILAAGTTLAALYGLTQTKLAQDIIKLLKGKAGP